MAFLHDPDDQRVVTPATPPASPDGWFTRADTDEMEWLDRVQGVTFLRDTQAEPISPALYAVWLTAHLANGGRVRPFPSWSEPFQQRMGRIWAPRQDINGIPEAYGAASLHILVPPDVNGHLRPIPLARPGWEYGHTMVYRLEFDPSSSTGLRATTNCPNEVRCHIDVKPFLDHPELLEAFRRDWPAGRSRPAPHRRRADPSLEGGIGL